MTLPDCYKDWIIERLIEKRQHILARPFPAGYSSEEKQMMDWLEDFCTHMYKEAVDALEETTYRLASEHSPFVRSLGHRNDCWVCERIQENRKLIAKLKNVG